MIHFKLGTVALAVALIFSGRAASAAFITQTVNYGSAADPMEAGGGSVSLTYNQFDPALGTLQDVIITLDSFDAAQAEVLNISSGPLPYTQSSAFNDNETVSVANGPSTTTSTLEAGHDAENPNGFSGMAAPAGPGFVPTISGTGPTQHQTVSSSVVIFPFVGSGTGTINLLLSVNSGNGSSSVSGQAGAIFTGWNADSYGSVKIQYDYLAVPEPCSYGIVFGAGLCVVVLRRQFLVKA
jgi:hypothetical protein